MRDQLAQTLKGYDADYIELRFEENNMTRLVYRGKELEETNLIASRGGNVRALAKGGWGFVSFNDPVRLRQKIELAVHQARLTSQDESKFSPVSPMVDIVEAPVGKNPAFLPLATKKQLLDEYNKLILSTPNIQTSMINYTDSNKKTIFTNSEGSYIEQSKVDIALRLAAVAREGNEVQQAGLSLGSNGDFAAIEELHDQVKLIARRAVELLNAPPVKGGEYTVVLDPVLAGVFAHEAFGHLSESDFVCENEKLREIMVLGHQFGGEHLNIIDDSTLPKLRGSYKYDDEGVLASPTYLVQAGILVGRLHSRETAAKMKENPTGNARALNYRYPPLVRMTNTFIAPDSVSFTDLIADIKEGIYAKNWYGGTTSMEMFTFSAGETYMIRNGEIAELMRPVVLTGNVFKTLKNIDAIGNDLEMNQGGGCGKGAQVPLPVSNGSPHIRIRHCLVGGR